MNREGWKREGKEARVDRPNRPWPNFFMIGLVTEQLGEIISEALPKQEEPKFLLGCSQNDVFSKELLPLWFTREEEFSWLPSKTKVAVQRQQFSIKTNNFGGSKPM